MSGWHEFNSEPAAGSPAILAVEKLSVAINEHLSSLVIPSSRAPRSSGRYKAQLSAPSVEKPTVTYVRKTVYASTIW
jgi:hypothetical protein